MAINPDWKDFMGPDAFIAPNAGMLRFVEREPVGETEPSGRKLRILQRYEWSNQLKAFDWFDVVLFDEAKDT